jgi:site-specific DNA-cytosine methylase/SNF2 family DNA or RNA helicase
MSTIPQLFASQRKRPQDQDNSSVSELSVIHVARAKSPIVLIPSPRKPSLQKPAPCKPSLASRNPSPRKRLSSTIDGANVSKRRRISVSSTKSKPQISSGPRLRAQEDCKIPLVLYEPSTSSNIRPSTARSGTTRPITPQLERRLAHQTCRQWLIAPAPKQPHIPAWRRLGLVLKPGERNNGFLSGARVASFHGFHTTRILSTLTSAVVSDGDSEDADRVRLQQSETDHDSEDMAKDMDLALDQTEVVQSPPLQVDQKLAAFSTSEETSTSEEDPAPRLRHRKGRVSYIQEPISDASEVENDSEASATYAPIASDSESELGEVASTLTATDEDTSATEADEPIVEIAKKPRAVSTTNKTAKPKAGKGIHTSLPPLDNIYPIFADMAAKALDLGFNDVLSSLGNRPINIATMCSGTESPLIALDLFSKGLVAQGKAPLRINHQFSAEIDVLKQGYIERNFQPRRLFRDVREFIPQGVKTATTAYGAEEVIPGGLDVLVAGFVCKDLSRLNNHQKGLDDGGESGDTWNAIYSYTKQFRPSVVLIENVRSEAKFWNTFEAKWAVIGYDNTWTYCDTKNYYIPQTRQRMYMIAIDKSQFGKNTKNALQHWADLMTKLERRASSPFDAFLTSDTSDQYEHTSLCSDPNWALCKLRYDQIRSEQRLGTRRPLTRWSDNGTIRPPDFANFQWYQSQSSRVYDCIDIAHLQGVQLGYDSQYKMAIWDVSQNVDRFKADPGIVSCITPGGINFVSNRHTALTGNQLLLLQGMPADKLLFAKESQKDRQDLAGNAMTTTVIGSSLVAALIAAREAFPKVTTHQYYLTSESLRDCPTLVSVKPRQHQTIGPIHPAELSLDELIEDARLSSRLCNCEGTRRISKAPIKVCKDCGHTACSDCAGNPIHAYGAVIITPKQRELGPNDFERKWRQLLPARLRFRIFPAMEAYKTAGGHVHKVKVWQAFIDRVTEVDVPKLYFSIVELKRHERSWKARYHAPEATLELVIDERIHWSLTVSCPPSEPGNSSLRALLERPIARGLVDSTLMDPEWQVFVPGPSTHTVTISGSEDRTSSWRSRMGLVDYRNETVPLRLHIQGISTDVAKKLTGEYEHLPHCGTAKSSLYKAIDSNAEATYLFLEQDPIGKQDVFVFSRGCERVPFGQHRMILGSLETSWQPFDIKDATPVRVQLIIPGDWKAQDVILQAPLHSAEFTIPTVPALSSKSIGDCSQALVLLDAKTKVALGVERFEQFAWALEHAKTLPPFGHWQTFVARCTKQNCECAPVVPRILWSVSEKGEATPSEDRKAAAQYERILKTRPEIFHVEASTSAAGTLIQVGTNIASLVHRAGNRLGVAQATSTWRLLTDHVEHAADKFPRFRLRSNGFDAPYAGSLKLKYTLGHEQLQSLGWMREQECGRRFILTEVEEAIHPGLGWRLEAKAEASTTLRGGVLADLPSFGKTVTTIALVSDEFEKTSTDGLLQQNRDLEPLSLIGIAATLVICPPHIAKQWHSEFRACLGMNRADSYNIIVIESFSDLERLGVSSIQAAKVMIVSWSVLADDAYVAQLAAFSAMPLPASTKGRAYDAWLDYSAAHIGSQVEAFQRLDITEFAEHTQGILDDRLTHDDFKAVVPLKIAHGSAYQSFSTMSKAAKQSKKKSSLPRAPRASKLSVPLLQMFRFNRLVVDEYHYLYDSKNSDNYPACAAVKRIRAPKRWVLSGTPALANFSDINQIASFLGVKLGRNVYGDGIVTTALEKRLMNEQTDVEKFVSSTETMSYQWHEARHSVAQNFLDSFVRQNEPALHDIACKEELHAIELGVAHHAIYLELSQHLISQRMQIKKLRSKSGSDRSERLNASLNNSATAEEALLRSALLFEIDEGQSGLSLLTTTREGQRKEVATEILSLLEQLRTKCLQRLNNPTEDHYLLFRKDVEHGNMFGDDEARQIIRKLIAKVEKRASSSKRTSNKASSAKELTALKELASEVRVSAHELTLRVRSQRFIGSIDKLLPILACSEKSQARKGHKCSSPSCATTADVDQLLLVSHCGHIICASCLQARSDSDACVHPGCEVPVQANNLIKVSDLGSPEENISQKSFGRKLGVISSLVKRLPEDDQGIIFVPNDEVRRILEDVLDDHEIAYHSLGTQKASAAKILEDFKTNTDPKKKKKVLVLNLASESAAGANLVNANHVIFVSPLLTKSQGEYDSAMAQAIARCRRYRQKKKVHIYHFAALRTIDVDILEHRHKRLDAIHSPETTLRFPPKSKRKEGTKLVRNRKGVLALVPLSWLADEQFRKMIQVDKEPESYTSLIHFSETFPSGHGDDDV